jgi:valyl-tRNA synthetase
MDEEKSIEIINYYEKIKEIEIREHESVEDLAEFQQVKKSKLEDKLEDFETPEKYEEIMESVDLQMLISLNNLIGEVNKHFDAYRPGMAAEEIIQHYWHVFADIYVEQVKSRLYLQDREGDPINRGEAEQESRNKAAAMLLHCTTVYLRLLHPFVPFVTEEVWSYLPDEIKDSEFIMYAKWPEFE